MTDSRYFARDIGGFAERTALISSSGAVSYADLELKADGFAASVGDSRALVFLEARNDVEAVVAYMGCLRAGHVVYLYGQGDESRLPDLVAKYRPNYLVGKFDGILESRHLSAMQVDLHPDLAVLLSTSGSTGSPKLVKLSRNNIHSNAVAISSYLSLSADDRAITSLKFNYSFGLSVLHSQFACGGALILSDEAVTSPSFWSTVREHGATSFAGVPYTFELLSKSDDWIRVPSLRYVTQAGGKLDPEHVRRIARLGKSQGWDFFVMYGQTEASPRMAYLPPKLAEQHPDAIGIAIPGGTLEIVDEHGATVSAPNQSGELVYRGPNVMLGYAETGADLATGNRSNELRTGDIAVRMDSGLFRIVGRSSRFVKPYGVRVNLDELQATLETVAPGVVCAGSDDQIVIADPNARSPDLAITASRFTGLPAFVFSVVKVHSIPKLPNGKTDYRTIYSLGHQGLPESAVYEKPPVGGIARVFSRMFLKQVKREVCAIIGYGTGEWKSVSQIYQKLVAYDGVEDDSTFSSLAGDSLSYVQTMIALEEYLGALPEGWETMTVSQLEEVGASESVI